MSTDQLIEICKANQITHILPTRDGELSFWSERKEILAHIRLKLGSLAHLFLMLAVINFHFSNNGRIHLLQRSQPLKHRLKVVKKNWVAKERFGSGSRNAFLNISLDQAKQLSASKDNRYIYQPFIEGKEFTAEIWISKMNHCHGPVLRWRNKIVDGESHHSTVFRNSAWGRSN